MRSTLLAFVTALSLVGCGNNNNSSLDGGNRDMQGGGGNDLAGTSRDLKAAGKGCYAILTCIAMGGSPQTCTRGASQDSVTKFQNYLNCAINACGLNAQDGGTKPCSNTTTDMGAAQCDQCLQNVDLCTPAMMSSDMCDFNFTSGGRPVTCMPGNAPECGACHQQIVTCVIDCVTDADCDGLMLDNGEPAVCVMGECGAPM
jgi:hypothetical protein